MGPYRTADSYLDLATPSLLAAKTALSCLQSLFRCQFQLTEGLSKGATPPLGGQSQGANTCFLPSGFQLFFFF